MAGFEGISWASKQMRYTLDDREFTLLGPDSKVCAVSRSIHYGLFLAFEGIRFYCFRDDSWNLQVSFLGWDRNLDRFRRGISFNLGSQQQHFVPTMEELETLFIDRFFRAPEMRAFFEEMADMGAQGYLRPFTVDEDQSIGVTFPKKPSIRAVAARYDRYLGEPFSGVVIPDYVRAIGVNGTGCLKLGINYLISIKAVDMAKTILPEAASALMLDDRPHLPLRDRVITEWDTSCCLIALSDDSIIRIPESPLILPSVTISGITTILKDMGVKIDERDITYGELLDRVERDEVVAICSIGTAGILNRCDELLLVDTDHTTLGTFRAKKDHPLHKKLGEARTTYWNIYRGEAPVPDGMKLFTYEL
jgi:branched-chain amino acid aminotransferase